MVTMSMVILCPRRPMRHIMLLRLALIPMLNSLRHLHLANLSILMVVTHINRVLIPLAPIPLKVRTTTSVVLILVQRVVEHMVVTMNQACCPTTQIHSRINLLNNTLLLNMHLNQLMSCPQQTHMPFPIHTKIPSTPPWTVGNIPYHRHRHL